LSAPQALPRTVPPVVSSPSSLWPLPQSVAATAAAASSSSSPPPPPPPPCAWSPLAPATFSRGCANGGDNCESFGDLAAAQAACAAEQACFALTSQPGGGAPWTLRAGGAPGSPSPSGEASYFIANAAQCRPPAPAPGCSVLDPAAFAVEVVGFADDVTAAAARRYASLLFAAYGTGGAAAPAGVPPNATVLPSISVNVTSADDDLRFSGLDESYVLSVAGGAARIIAPTVFGAVWALETFTQLVHRVWATDAGGRLATSWFEVCDVEVADAPRFPFRGVMLDSARHFLTPAALRQAIDLMSSIKLNALHIHFTDDQSWPLYIPALPQLTNASAFTAVHVFMPDELRALAQYGRERGVLVFPEIDTPAHSSGLRAAIADWGCRVPGAGSVLVDPLWLQTSNFSAVRAIWAAMDAAFLPSAPFHMGGDEVEGSEWAACPNATAWQQSNNLTGDVGFNVCSWYERSVYSIIRGLGRDVVAWEDACFDPKTWPADTSEGHHLMLQQWNQGQFASDICVTLSTNASVIASGPYSLGEVGTMNRFDPFNNSCGGPTPRMLAQVVGPEYLLWDDAGDTSSTDLIHDMMTAILGLGESGWSSDATIWSPIDEPRYRDMRCRLAARGIGGTARPFESTGAYCVDEGNSWWAPPWNAV